MKFNEFWSRLEAANVRDPKRHCVYVLELDDGDKIKVGYSSRLYKRLQELNRTESRFRGRIGRVAVCNCDNAKDWEFQFHNHMHRCGFSDYAVSWETYRLIGFADMNSFDFFIDFLEPTFDKLWYPKFKNRTTKDWRKEDREEARDD